MYNNKTVGSLESSDLLIKINNLNQIEFINLVSNMDEQLVIKRIESYLKQYGINHVGITVHYNGANDWVIKSRIEALVCSIKEESND